jgi:hypothetical protein
MCYKSNKQFLVNGASDGAVRKGIWVFNDASGEYDSPGIDGRVTEYREVLADWLNRALACGSADRDAAERVGTLIEAMNESTAEYLEAVNSWNRDGRPEAVPLCKTFREIASAHHYELELDLCPRHGSKKWHMAFHCVTAPSGHAFERWQQLNKKWPAPQSLIENWPEVPKRFNPECQAVNAVVFIALEGRLGTMKRCQVKECQRWYLTKDDCRARYCPHHDSDDLRKGTSPRKKQLAAAQKRVRERAKAIDERSRAKSRAAGFVMPGRRRAKHKSGRG